MSLACFFGEWRRKALAVTVLFGMASLAACPAYSQNYSFAWSANPPPVAGYRLYYKKGGYAGPPFYGSDSVQGPSPLDVGNQRNFTISGLDANATYHFALTAYNGDQESDFSATITVQPAISSPPADDDKNDADLAQPISGHPNTVPELKGGLLLQVINMLLLDY